MTPSVHDSATKKLIWESISKVTRKFLWTTKPTHQFNCVASEIRTFFADILLSRSGFGYSYFLSRSINWLFSEKAPEELDDFLMERQTVPCQISAVSYNFWITSFREAHVIATSWNRTYFGHFLKCQWLLRRSLVAILANRINQLIVG